MIELVCKIQFDVCTECNGAFFSWFPTRCPQPTSIKILLSDASKVMHNTFFAADGAIQC